MSAQTIQISLNQLTAWEGNVRKTAPDTGLNELAASIAAHGLLQSLVVQQEENGAYSVIAGRRRFMALNILVEGETIKPDMPVSCLVVAKGASATEISLAENVVREQMHPADQFDAFQALFDEGKPVVDIAARFGITETIVRQRMKLADVSPKIIKAYREGKLTLEQVIAYAVTNDRKRQERFFKENPSAQAHYIRRSLTEGEISADENRVKFVTLAAYQKAGGATRRDLFTEGDKGVFILNAELLEKLVGEKLQSEAETVKTEGWKWVEVYPELTWHQKNEMKLKQEYAERQPLSDEAKTEIETLQAEYDQLHEGEEEFTDQQSERIDEIDARIEELQNTPQVWTPEILAIGGAIVTIDSNGKADIERGYIKPEDQKAAKGSKEKPGKEKEKPEFSISLTQELNTHQSAALGAVLATKPDVALAAVVHCLALKVFFPANGFGKSSISVSLAWNNPAKDMSAKNCLGIAELEKQQKEWKKKLPSKADGLFKWCIEQEQPTLLSLLAFMAGLTAHSRAGQKDALAEAVRLDMAQWFTPTEANFFGRIGKPQVLTALDEATGEKQGTATAGLKKAALAKHAEKAIQKAAVKWIPSIFRKAA